MACVAAAQLLYCESEDPAKPIQMYINSPGGVVTAGLAIYDTMQYIGCPVHTLCIGQASSMGSLLLAAGEKGQRRSLPHARVSVRVRSWRLNSGMLWLIDGFIPLRSCCISRVAARKEWPRILPSKLRRFSGFASCYPRYMPSIPGRRRRRYRLH